MLTPNMNITDLNGIGTVRAKSFAKLDIFTIEDLVTYYPRDYEYRGKITKADEACIGTQQTFILEISSNVENKKITSSKNGRLYEIQKFTASDESGTLIITFFNQPFLINTFKIGLKFRFFGEVKGNFIYNFLSSPSFELILENQKPRDFISIYSLTSGIYPKMISAAIKQALMVYDDPKFDKLDKEIKEEYSLCDLKFALNQIHFPDNEENLKKARRRLVFEELYDFQCKMIRLSKKENKDKSKRLFYPNMKEFTAKLSFTLTKAQKFAIQDLLIDMTGEKKPTNIKNDNILNEYIPASRRLIQGDVGSGKTMVAAAAIFAAFKNNGQSAFMAPTGILARQHYETLSELLGKFGAKTSLLVGSLKKSEKKSICEKLLNGETDLVIGTHALLEESVAFKNLLLVITDEQHRFGVNQRNILKNKDSKIEKNSIKPHMAAMSATPIPRTLSMVLYGDMDVSVIDEMPPGRKPIKTIALAEENRNKVYEFIKQQILTGRQVYIVCPLVENERKEEEYIPYFVRDESKELKSVTEYAKKIKEQFFFQFNISIIHGRLKQSLKDEIMEDFKNGKIDILVSTTVIEVGVNVPNACVMLIENAERFGLSQLHQLRGRVGRGTSESFCILMSPLLNNGKNDSIFKQRIDIMCQTENGFEIAEKDLEMRGPGEYFGRRQHGELCFKIADLAADIELVSETRKLALKKMST